DSRTHIEDRSYAGASAERCRYWARDLFDLGKVSLPGAHKCTLRYAIERFPQQRRKRMLAGKF
ncbi:MAG TPA: hypothetical protein VMV98_09740, partial [Acidobacteriaceae bacterium]|nr:hypothetical protein [Acidobacteriaceae bacterium]